MLAKHLALFLVTKCIRISNYMECIRTHRLTYVPMKIIMHRIFQFCSRPRIACCQCCHEEKLCYPHAISGHLLTSSICRTQCIIFLIRTVPTSLFNVYLVVNSILVVYISRLSEGKIKPLLTYLCKISGFEMCSCVFQ